MNFLAVQQPVQYLASRRWNAQNNCLRTHLTGTDGNQYIIEKGICYLITDEQYLPVPSPAPFVMLESKAWAAMAYIVPAIICTVILGATLVVFTDFGAELWFSLAAHVMAFCGYGIIGTLLLMAGITAYNIIREAPVRNQDTQYARHGALIVVASRHTGDAKVADVLTQALAQLADTHSGVRAVIALRFGDAIGYLYRSGETTVRFDRAKPEWEMHNDFSSAVFARETWAEFQEYVDETRYRATDHINRLEHKRGGTPEAITTNLRTIWGQCVALIITCLCAASLSAQPRDQQVRHYLGDHQYETTKPNGRVKFVFERAVLPRTGYGNQPYGVLLSDATGYTNADNIGQLEAITVNDIPVARYRASATRTAEITQSPNTATDPVRPRGVPQPLFDEPTDRPTGGFTLPDSSTMAQNMRQWRDRGDEIGNSISQNGGTIWDTVMYFFWRLLAVLILTGSICWFCASYASKESAVNVDGAPIVGGWIVSIQQFSVGLLFLHVMAVAIVWLVNVWLAIMWWQTHFLVKIAAYGFVLWATYKSAEKITPDLRIMASRAFAAR